MEIFHQFFNLLITQDFLIELIQKTLCGIGASIFCSGILGILSKFKNHIPIIGKKNKLINFYFKKFSRHNSFIRLIFMLATYVATWVIPLGLLACIIIILAKLHCPLDGIISNQNIVMIVFLLPITFFSLMLLIGYKLCGFFSYMPELNPIRYVTGFLSLLFASIVELFIFSEEIYWGPYIVTFLIFLFFAISFIVSTLFTGTEIQYMRVCLTDTNNNSLYVSTKNIKQQGKQLEIQQDTRIICYSIYNIITLTYCDVLKTEKCIIWNTFLHTLSDQINDISQQLQSLLSLIINLFLKLFKH